MDSYDNDDLLLALDDDLFIIGSEDEQTETEERK